MGDGGTGSVALYNTFQKSKFHFHYVVEFKSNNWYG